MLPCPFRLLLPPYHYRLLLLLSPLLFTCYCLCCCLCCYPCAHHKDIDCCNAGCTRRDPGPSTACSAARQEAGCRKAAQAEAQTAAPPASKAPKAAMPPMPKSAEPAAVAPPAISPPAPAAAPPAAPPPSWSLRPRPSRTQPPPHADAPGARRGGRARLAPGPCGRRGGGGALLPRSRPLLPELGVLLQPLRRAKGQVARPLHAVQPPHGALHQIPVRQRVFDA
jgi:hypothetical protein